MQTIVKFFHNVAEEMRKVRWPHRKELVKYTITVVSTVVFFILFFTLIDLGITKIIEIIP
ncbi:preprotein translocase subunit SecE [Fervidibacillus halotolerans]|uniref:Protein translocase subunit SecE n=1 Tax=Fervidibacillus halotolerans TaxID=2980027 RepID=A0A9E8LZD5_9BACI|nr:preprotein translocase subunit SecE [Fervidibacillus halotolerans]WAA12379.1 preprotein translocase subunit SecE [Fervidibacillus halotolerans]